MNRKNALSPAVPVLATIEKLEGRRLLAVTPWNHIGRTDVSDREQFAVVETTADGKILVAREGFLHRYVANTFQPDLTFGDGDGVVELAGQRVPVDIVDIKVIDGGRILLAGHSGGATGADFTVARLNPDGSLDPTFGGSAKGYANTASGVAWADFGAQHAVADAMAVAPDGRIAVVGDDGDNSAVVAVFDADGSPDTDFDTDGKLVWAAKVITSEEESGTAFDGYYGRAVGFTSDGRLVVGGFKEFSFDVNPGFTIDYIPHRDRILKYISAAGAIELVQLDPIDQEQGGYEDLAVLGDDSVLAAGSANQGWLVKKFQPDGQIDRTFADNGQSITGDAAAFDVRHTATRIVVDPADGSYFLLGTQPPRPRVYLARYTADGVIDTQLGPRLAGEDGRVPMPMFELAGAADMTLLGDDPVVLVSIGNDIGETATRLVYAVPPVAPQAYIDGNRVLKILGSEADDTLHVHRRANGRTVVVINGVAQSFATRKIRRVHMFGFGGDDVLTAGRRAPGLYIDGGAGHDFVSGQSGADLLAGGSGDDTLIGNFGNDTIYGQRGRDRLEGRGDNDQLFGQQDIDTLFGGNNADFLHGENDTADILDGGDGADIAVLDEKDQVENVESTQTSGTPPA